LYCVTCRLLQIAAEKDKEEEGSQPPSAVDLSPNTNPWSKKSTTTTTAIAATSPPLSTSILAPPPLPPQAGSSTMIEVMPPIIDDHTTIALLPPTTNTKSIEAAPLAEHRPDILPATQQQAIVNLFNSSSHDDNTLAIAVGGTNNAANGQSTPLPAINNNMVPSASSLVTTRTALLWDSNYNAKNKVEFKCNQQIVTKHYRPRTFSRDNTKVHPCTQFMIEYDPESMKAKEQPLLFYYIPADCMFMRGADKPIIRNCLMTCEKPNDSGGIYTHQIVPLRCFQTMCTILSFLLFTMIMTFKCLVVQFS
jgi:hypothetical protein